MTLLQPTGAENPTSAGGAAVSTESVEVWEDVPADPSAVPVDATIESVQITDDTLPTSRLLPMFSRIFGPSTVTDLGSAIDSDKVVEDESEYVIHPLKKPFRLFGLLFDPVKEANLLLPAQLDPFSDPSEVGPVNANEQRRREEARRQKLRKQQALLNTRTGVQWFDDKWHFQVQAGGSFRQGNNPSTNINGQVRAERHSIYSDFTSRLGGFYNQLEGGVSNRRIFGETNYDRNLRGRWISYIRQDAEWDTARLINIRAVSSVGLGFRFIDTINERLVARLGPTMSYVDYDIQANNPDETRSGWLIESDYRRLIGEASRFELVSTAFPDFDSEQQFRIRTEGALIFPIGKASVWNWKVGVRHEYIMDPVATTNANDVEGYFSLVYTR